MRPSPSRARTSPAYAGAVAASSSNLALATTLDEIHGEPVDHLAGLITAMRADGYLGPWFHARPMAELLVSIGDGVAVRTLYASPTSTEYSTRSRG